VAHKYSSLITKTSLAFCEALTLSAKQCQRIYPYTTLQNRWKAVVEALRVEISLRR